MNIGRLLDGMLLVLIVTLFLLAMYHAVLVVAA